MSTPTPGPWEVRQDEAGRPPMHSALVVVASGSLPTHIRPVARLELQGRHTEANARLIAAAPELLHALQVILYDKSISAWLREHDPKALYQVEDAVAKAEGGAT